MMPKGRYAVQLAWSQPAGDARNLLQPLGCQLRTSEDGSGEQEILFRGVVFHSRPRADGNVDDYGLVARTRNPWNREALMRFER
jgi:hypothetical protein